METLYASKKWNIIELFKKDAAYYCLPKGITGIMQLLDISVSKSLKESLRKKYIDFCIYLKEIKNIKWQEKLSLNGLIRFEIQH